MNKETQDLVWSVLPKEFKEEVRRMYRIDDSDVDQMIATIMLENIFGIHNLTSDAEGEDEMLTASRKRVQELYSSYCTERDEEEPGSNRSSLGGRIAMLQELFGSKCLPDEEQPKQKDCDNPLADKEGCRWRNDGKCTFDSACCFEPLNPQEPKPAELKFKFGDKVRTMNVIPKQDIGRVGTVVINKDGLCNVRYNDNSGVWCDESDLEPYTEPTDNLIPPDSGELKSQEPDNQFDTILKDGFSKERRLNIAAMAMQGLLSNTTRFSSYEISDLVRISLNCADALIKKAEGGSDE